MSFDLDNIDKPIDVQGGEWVSDIPNHPGMRLKVRSVSFSAFEAAHNRLLRSYGKRAASKLDSPEYKDAFGGLLAQHLLLDWEKAITKGGEDVKFDKKTAATVLSATDAAGIGDAFRDAVTYAAGVVKDRHLGLIDDMAGN